MKPILKCLLLIATLFAFSCKKEKSNDLISVTVIFHGNVEVDGCGWWLKLEDGTEYYPENLTDKFKENNLKLLVSYNRLNKANKCNFGIITTTKNSERNFIHLLRSQRK